VTIPIFQEADFAQLAVRVNANVQPAPGYYITNITADPPLVSVRGTPDILRTLTTIETQPVNLTGLDTDTRIPAQLNPPEGVTLEGTQIVDVIITVEAQSAFRSFEVPIRAIGLGSGLSATILPRSAVVTISGPLPVLDALDELEDIIVSVDLTDLEPDSYQVEPEVQIINIPEDDLRELEIESVLPTLIQVEITEEGASP
jgi:YbbR domain-containing protein